MPFRNKTTGQYPVSHEQIRKANPNISFPKYFEVANGYDWVYPINQPEYNPSTQRCYEGTPVFKGESSDPHWEQTWVVEDYSEEVIAAIAQQNLNANKTKLMQDAQESLDHFARQKGYDNILTACSYATSTNASFAADGQYCVEKRDATWTKLFEIFAEMDSGTRESNITYTTLQQGEMPDLTWPE